jgi:hypothetical protein
MTVRLDPGLEKIVAWVGIGAIVFLWFGQVPGRIAVHFGVPPEWAYSAVNGFAPLALLFLVMAVVLVIRWIGQARR